MYHLVPIAVRSAKDDDRIELNLIAATKRGRRNNDIDYDEQRTTELHDKLQPKQRGVSDGLRSCSNFDPVRVV